MLELESLVSVARPDSSLRMLDSCLSDYSSIRLTEMRTRVVLSNQALVVHGSFGLDHSEYRHTGEMDRQILK